MRNTLSHIKKCFLSLYKKIYNDKKHFNYTSFRIMRNTLSHIKKYLLSLYNFLYNEK